MLQNFILLKSRDRNIVVLKKPIQFKISRQSANTKNHLESGIVFMVIPKSNDHRAENQGPPWHMKWGQLGAFGARRAYDLTFGVGSFLIQEIANKFTTLVSPITSYYRLCKSKLSLKSSSVKQIDSQIEKLDTDLLSSVFKFLPLKDLRTCQNVCKKWRDCFAIASCREAMHLDDRMTKEAIELLLNDILTQKNLTKEYIRTFVTSSHPYWLVGSFCALSYMAVLLTEEFNSIESKIQSHLSISLEERMALFEKENTFRKILRESCIGRSYCTPQFDLQSVEEYDQMKIEKISHGPYMIFILSMIVASPILAIALTSIEKIIKSYPKKAKGRLLTPLSQLATHPLLQNQLCKLSGRAPLIPVKDICGHTLDYPEVLKSDQPRCPITRATLHIDELFFDHHTFEKIQRCWKQIINSQSWLSKRLNRTHPLLQHCTLPEDQFSHLKSLLNHKFSIDSLSLFGIRSITDLKALTIDTSQIDDLDMIRRSMEIFPKKLKRDLEPIDLSKAFSVTANDISDETHFVEFCDRSGMKVEEYESFESEFTATHLLGKAMAKVLSLQIAALCRTAKKIQDAQPGLPASLEAFDSSMNALSKILHEVQENPDYCVQFFRHDFLTAHHPSISNAYRINIIEATCELLIRHTHELKKLEKKRLNETLERYLNQAQLQAFWEKHPSGYSLAKLQEDNKLQFSELFQLNSSLSKSS